jgi:PAS domain S-box-containing protein
MAVTVREKIDSFIGSFVNRQGVSFEEERKLRFFVIVTFIIFLVNNVFLVRNLPHVGTFRILNNVGTSIGLIISILAVRYLSDPKPAFRLSLLILGSYCLILLNIGGTHGSRMLWMLVYPLYIFFLLGTKEGLAWATMGFILSVVILMDPGALLSTYPYQSIIKARFLFTYALIATLAYMAESVRQRYQESMERKQLNLQREVEERIRAEEALRREHALRNGVIEQAAEGLCVCHEIEQFPYVRFTVWNDHMKKLTGYELEEINEKGWYQSLYPDPEVQAKAMLRMERMRRGEDLRGEEWEITRSDGDKRVVTIFTSLLEASGGETHVLALMQDVTERQVIEEELRRYRLGLEDLVAQRTADLQEANAQLSREIDERKRIEDALKESEQKYRALVETTSDWIWEVDADGVYTYCSPRVTDLLGFQPQEILGRTPFDFMDDNEAAKVGQEFARIVESRRSFFGLENVVRHKDGHEVVLETTGSPVLDSEGVLTGYRGVDRDITERKKSEIQLNEINSQLQRQLNFNEALLSAIPTPVFFKDADGLYLGCNRAFSESLGVTPEQIKGKTVFELWPGENSRVYHQKDLELLQNPDRQSYEFTVRDKHGEQRDVIFAKDAFYDENGEVAGLVGAFTDISERKRAEKALSEAYEILSRSPVVAFLWKNEQDWPVEFVTENVEALTGYTARDFTSGTIPYSQIVHPEDLKKVTQEVAAVASCDGKEPFSHEPYRILTKDGTVKWIDDNTIIRKDDNGTITHYQGIVSDVTDRETARMELAEMQALLEAAVEQSPAGIVIAEAPDVRIRLANSAALAFRGSMSTELTEITVEEHVRRWQLFHWDGTPYNPEELPLSKAVLLGETTRDAEVLIRDIEGIERYVLTNAGPVFNEKDEVVAGVVVFYDVTERRKLESERQQLERQVQHAQKLESLGVLAGGIAHDFNNILTAILGNADLALLSLSPVAPARDKIDEIVNASRRAAGLANQMLAYSGKGKFILKSIDLSELVREMAQLLEVSISKKALLRFNFTENLPTFEGDITQIRQVIMNLITNASEALGEDMGYISLSTASQYCDRAYLEQMNEILRASYETPLPEGLYIALEVADTGCGMDEETRKKIFDPFFTTKFAGRGLGMAALLGIVRGHYGAIRIYSEVDRGTTFKILFPASPDASGTAIAKDAQLRAENLPLEGTVLIVDDEESVREVASCMVMAMGFDVLTAPNGLEAVEVFSRQADKIVCVLLDLTMPLLDGEQTFRKISLIRPDVKVILSSGYNEQEATQRFAGRGLAGFIQKPYTLEGLEEKLKAALQNR